MGPRAPERLREAGIRRLAWSSVGTVVLLGAGWATWALVDTWTTDTPAPALPLPALASHPSPVRMEPPATFEVSAGPPAGAHTARVTKAEPRGTDRSPSASSEPVSEGVTWAPSRVAGNHNGLIVANVGKDTPFDRIGLQSGDVVMSINGQPLHAQSDTALWLYPIIRGQAAQAYVLRDGHTLPLTLAFTLPDSMQPTAVPDTAPTSR